MQGKELIIKVNHKDAVDITELTKVLESTNDKTLNLVRKTYPYKMPSGYLSWRYLSSVISMGLVGMENKQQLIATDYATFLHSHKCALWFTQSAPIYCIKEELLNTILNTDILDSSEVLKDIECPIPSFILMFPKNKIISAENTSVDFCVVHFGDANKPELSQGEKYGVTVPFIYQEHEINIHWSSVDLVGTVWFSGMGLLKDGSIAFEDNSIGRNKIDEGDRAFLKLMRSVVLQVFLLLQYEPEILGDVAPEETPTPKTKGFSKPKNQDKEKILYPRWINEPSRKSASRPKVIASGSHASPVTHWRRGHWRRVATGEGRTDRKWVRIAPTLINP